jgi:ABC-type nitrate/sulfonate/bicarbonate transport system substrate-binding protein
MRRLIATAAALIFTLASVPHGANAEETKLSVIVFPGIPNLPMYVAQAKGFYAKRGLSVELTFTPNSNELRNGLAEGRYQIAQAAVDNAFALKDKANVDIAVVIGGDNSFNHLLVQPEIKSLADVKGKTVAVDAVNTAFAFQLYEMLRQKGIEKTDYTIKASGGTAARLDAMINDKSIVASMMNPPYSVLGIKAGLKDMGTAAAALGAYQGSSMFVLRSWAGANGDTLVKYLQATIEGTRWVADPKNKAEAVALLAARLKLPEDVAALTYDSTRSDFSPDAALDMAGVNNVLMLRAKYEGGIPASPDKYIDLSFYEKALAGL